MWQWFPLTPAYLTCNVSLLPKMKTQLAEDFRISTSFKLGHVFYWTGHEFQRCFQQKERC
jgi:hypothetical protein